MFHSIFNIRLGIWDLYMRKCIFLHIFFLLQSERCAGMCAILFLYIFQLHTMPLCMLLTVTRTLVLRINTHHNKFVENA